MTTRNLTLGAIAGVPFVQPGGDVAALLREAFAEFLVEKFKIDGKEAEDIIEAVVKQ